MYYEQNRERFSKKTRIIAGAIIAVAIILLLIPTIINALKSAKVSILVTPYESAIVTINGKNYNNGSYSFFPAENVEITIKADGFETKTFTANLKAHETLAIHDYLVNSESKMNYYYTNSTDYAVLKLIASDEQAKTFLSESLYAEQIRDFLPFNHNTVELSPTLGISIGRTRTVDVVDATDEENCSSFVCIKVIDSSKTKDEELIRQLLKEKGFNYDNYQVFYE